MNDRSIPINHNTKRFGRTRPSQVHEDKQNSPEEKYSQNFTRGTSSITNPGYSSGTGFGGPSGFKRPNGGSSATSGNDSKKGKNPRRPNGNWNPLQAFFNQAAYALGTMYQTVPGWGGHVPNGGSPSGNNRGPSLFNVPLITDGTNRSIYVEVKETGEVSDNGINDELPIFRSELGEDPLKTADHAPEMEKFQIRSDWRASVWDNRFTSDMGYAELPSGIIDEGLHWMQTHWKHKPTNEERVILVRELTSFCGMMLRKHNVKNVKPAPPIRRPVDGVFRDVAPDYPHQVHAMVAQCLDVGEPLFYATQHPVPAFRWVWPLVALFWFNMLVFFLILSLFFSLPALVPCVVIFSILFWATVPIAVSDNSHWYYYAFSPRLRFQFGSRR